MQRDSVCWREQRGFPLCEGCDTPMATIEQLAEEVRRLRAEVDELRLLVNQIRFSGPPVDWPSMATEIQRPQHWCSKTTDVIT